MMEENRSLGQVFAAVGHFRGSLVCIKEINLVSDSRLASSGPPPPPPPPVRPSRSSGKPRSHMLFLPPSPPPHRFFAHRCRSPTGGQWRLLQPMDSMAASSGFNSRLVKNLNFRYFLDSDVLENDDIRLDNVFLASLIHDLIKRSATQEVDWLIPDVPHRLAANWNISDDYARYRNLLWTAPELLRDGAPFGTQKADVYSFGIILYEMFGRKGPYGTCELPPRGEFLFVPLWSFSMRGVSRKNSAIFIQEIVERVREGPSRDADGNLGQPFRPDLKALPGFSANGQLMTNPSLFPNMTTRAASSSKLYQQQLNKADPDCEQNQEFNESISIHKVKKFPTSPNTHPFTPIVIKANATGRKRHRSSGDTRDNNTGACMTSPPSVATLSALLTSGGGGDMREPTPSIGKEGSAMDDYLWLCIRDCWAECPDDRPDFRQIRARLSPLRSGMKANIVDHAMDMMERYTNNLEELVDERTQLLKEEKQKTEALLYRMLPPAVAHRLARGEAVSPESFDSVVNLLNELYTLFDGIIRGYDVYKVETIGDAYMVVSGLPLRNANKHAGEIASMALEILEAAKQFRVPHMPTTPVKLRIGIHTGPVVAGVVGLTMPRYCLFGDTVNTASRMESNGEPYRIHISEQCREHLELIGGYLVSDRGVISVKGKGDVRTYWLEGLEQPSQPNSSAAAGGASAPAVRQSAQQHQQQQQDLGKLLSTSAVSLRRRSPKLARCPANGGSTQWLKTRFATDDQVLLHVPNAARPLLRKASKSLDQFPDDRLLMSTAMRPPSEAHPETFHLLYEEHSISVPALIDETFGSKPGSVAGEPNNFKAWLYNKFKRMVPANPGSNAGSVNSATEAPAAAGF
ncbi:unnamed protein product [Notodromas monacha]|uniref:Guanylate cyclase n=1 Tax=Notodromas monacha TaxID=399045 RepID=A0A7R9BNB8_9CRUS|nr:unnamed protein product [Notodromas monacha]CAG0917844.1 unnamed protein product [Notodromas monacha]